MKVSLDPLKRLEINGEALSLHAGVPVLNGKILADWQAHETPEAGISLVVYTAPDLGSGRFRVEVLNPAAPDEVGWLRYELEGLPDGLVLDSFGLHFGVVENARAFLRQGSHSWDGSFYVDAENLDSPSGGALPSITGFAMTQLLPFYGDAKLVLGFDRHDRFQQTFTFYPRVPPELTIETHWDQKNRHGLKTCASERLLFFTHPEAEQGLRNWADQVAAASPLPPRVPGARITGWCSWYNLYASITEENLLEHLESTAVATRRESLPMRVFQVDDGFTPEMGDWLEVKPQFPRGMKAILDDIRSAGFIPGLWIAPFMVGNRSRLYREHPDWVVQDREKGGPLIQYTFYGEFRWHKRSEEYYILDTTHPPAFEYLRRVFRTWRQDWGCEYFKTDFMYFGIEHGPQRAARRTPGMTRVEIWRQVAEMIREEIGAALWLGCGCPLWSAAGLVDCMRTGRDVGVRWLGDSASIDRLRDTATRNFANGILWQNDPDVVLLREQFQHLEKSEVRSLAVYAGLSGGVLMTSDDLQILSEERLQLWKFLLRLPTGRCNFPLLDSSAAAFVHPDGEMGKTFGTVDGVLVQVVAGEPEMVFCFNLDDHPVQRTYPLAILGFSGSRYLFDVQSGDATREPVQLIHLQLSPHEGKLFFLSSQAWTSSPVPLPTTWIT